MTINSKADLANYIDNALNNWNFASQQEELVERLTSTIHCMDDSPRYGTDWAEFLEELEWDELISQADRECKAAKHTPEKAAEIYEQGYRSVGMSDIADQFLKDLTDIDRHFHNREE